VQCLDPELHPDNPFLPDLRILGKVQLDQPDETAPGAAELPELGHLTIERLLECVPKGLVKHILFRCEVIMNRARAGSRSSCNVGDANGREASLGYCRAGRLEDFLAALLLDARPRTHEARVRVAWKEHIIDSSIYYRSAGRPRSGSNPSLP
jgi:hypothetical protein